MRDQGPGIGDDVTSGGVQLSTKKGQLGWQQVLQKNSGSKKDNGFIPSENWQKITINIELSPQQNFIFNNKGEVKKMISLLLHRIHRNWI